MSEVRLPAIFLVIVVSFTVYFNSLSGGFVYDDAYQVLGNQWIRDAGNIPEIFTSSVSGYRGAVVSNYYRPPMHLIYMAAYKLFGLKPWGFHLVNVVFHAGVSVLVFLIISRLLRKFRVSSSGGAASPASMAALLFAAHPIHTEAVAWVAGVPELSFTFFYLLALYLYIRSDGRLGAGYVFSVLSFFAAALCKETGLTLPLVIVAYDWSTGKAGGRARDYLKRYSPYLLAAVLYFILRYNALGGAAPVMRHAELSAYQHVINVFPLFARYAAKLILPVNLNAFHVLHPASSVLEPGVLAALAVTAGFLLAAFAGAKKDKAAFFGLAAFAVPLLPVLYIPGLGVNAFTERYLYLPSFGFVLLVSVFLGRASDRPGKALALAAAVFAVIGVYSFAAMNRNAVWRDDLSLWEDTVRKSPDGAEPHYDFGLALYGKGRVDEAIRQYRVALGLKDSAGTRLNLGVAYFSKGWADKAIEQYHAALGLEPGSSQAHYNLGLAYRQKGLVDKAIGEYLAAIALRPTPAAHLNLGMAYGAKGMPDKAVEEFLKAVALEPSFADAYYNLGLAYREKGLTDESLECLREAMRLRPGDAEIRNNLGVSYAEKGLMDEALGQFEEAARLKPSDPGIRGNLEMARRAKSGR